MMLKREDQLKAAGMESCALRYRDQLIKAQRLAVELARSRGTITSDDVREEAIKRGLNLSFGKNWVGSIFRGKHWEKVSFVQSRHEGGHGRIIAVWKLKDQPKPVSTVPVRQEPIKKPSFNTELFTIPTIPSYDELLG